MLQVGPMLAVSGGLFVVVAVAVCAAAGLGHARGVVTGSLRALAQLAVVSFAIVAIVESLVWTAAFLVVMLAVATGTSARRMKATGWRGLWAALPIAAGTVPALGLLMATGAVPPRGIVVVPVGGILIGGAMTATTLAGQRIRDELRLRHGEVDAALALGFLPREAIRLVCLPAASRALVPALDQTRTVGLVTLPGAFVGMLLGGATPVEAGAVQLVVLVALLAVESIAIAMVVELAAAGLLQASARTGPISGI